MFVSKICGEAQPYLSEMMKDPFGNYLFQKIADKVDENGRTDLVNQVRSRPKGVACSLFVQLRYDRGHRYVFSLFVRLRCDEYHTFCSLLMRAGRGSPLALTLTVWVRVS